MTLPKAFKEYLEQGIIKKHSPNKSRAEFLIQESDRSFRALKKRIDVLGIDDDNANSIIKDCYDIIMELIRARLLMSGFNSAGQYAHEAEVSYLKEMGFTNLEISFMNDLRYFRNSVTYYGKILDVEYAKKVVSFLDKIHPQLRNNFSKKNS